MKLSGDLVVGIPEISLYISTLHSIPEKLGFGRLPCQYLVTFAQHVFSASPPGDQKPSNLSEAAWTHSLSTTF